MTIYDDKAPYLEAEKELRRKWRGAFENASTALFNATGGQHYLKNIPPQEDKKRIEETYKTFEKVGQGDLLTEDPVIGPVLEAWGIVKKPSSCAPVLA